MATCRSRAMKYHHIETGRCMRSKGTHKTHENNRNVSTHLLMSPVQLVLENDLPVNEALHFVGQGVEGFNQGLDQLG